MGKRIDALFTRLAESAQLFSRPIDRLKYLIIIYIGRIFDHAGWTRLRPSVIVDIQHAQRSLRMAIRANGSDWGVLRGIFLELEYKIDTRNKEVRRIVDLGSNCGYASLFMGTEFPQAEIVAVEPLPHNIRALQRNLDLNAVKMDVIEAAIATEDGEADLLMTGNDACESLVPTHPWKQKIRVKTLSMESLLRAKGWNHVDLVKIDIEGYERKLLSGKPEWLAKIDVIVAELHGAYGIAEFQDDLEPLGFEVMLLSSGYEKTYIARRGGP